MHHVRMFCLYHTRVSATNASHTFAYLLLSRCSILVGSMPLEVIFRTVSTLETSSSAQRPLPRARKCQQTLDASLVTSRYRKSFQNGTGQETEQDTLRLSFSFSHSDVSQKGAAL